MAEKWTPTPKDIEDSNLVRMMKSVGIQDPDPSQAYRKFHRWTVENRQEFWAKSISELGIPFKEPFTSLEKPGSDVRTPVWLHGAKLNISDSCFLADSKGNAVVYQRAGGGIEFMSYLELNDLTSRVSNGLKDAGFAPGDAIAIDMLMTVESVAIYLGIVRAGCAAVSIADSFAPEEIGTRLRISDAKGIFTQDHIERAGKKLPLFDKVVKANAPKAIVLPANPGQQINVDLREGDLEWSQFLSSETNFESVECQPDTNSNILFSSGTTGDPKAIPWTHTTPIKCAVDGFYHHDIHPGDVVAWPTNLGWMMGPWLIYASLINKATIALFEGAPTGRDFGKFVQDAKVNMLGLVPSVVKAWRKSACMEDLNWDSIKCFSSTGECSNPDDYSFLMDLAGNRPVIEYCGGTEIGGGYITGTMIQEARPSTFSTPAVGLDFYILDEESKEAESGEIFLVPPSIGLSNTLLNRDHEEVYYSGTPKSPKGETLRRHGDQIVRLPDGYFQAQGRADDTMNLGGIKVSSAEIERTLNLLDGITETAAIAVSPPGGGPSELVIFAVTEGGDVDKTQLQKSMQNQIKTQLNPLFKIHDTVITDKLPRTASNKVMRRVLRKEYQAS